MAKFEFYIDKFTSGSKRYLVEIDAETKEEAQSKAISYGKGEGDFSTKETFIDSDIGNESGGFEMFDESGTWQHNEW